MHELSLLRRVAKKLPRPIKKLILGLNISNLREAIKHWVFSFESLLVCKYVLPRIYLPRLDKYSPNPLLTKVPHFLVMSYKYCHSNPKLGLSNEDHTVLGTLAASKIATFSNYYLDMDFSGGLMGEAGFLDAIESERPDLLILSSYQPRSPGHPRFDVLKMVREKCGIPIVVIWHDSVHPLNIENAEYMLDHVDLNVSLDSGTLPRHFAGNKKFMQLWAVVDEGIFHPGPIERNIPLSFLGSVGSYRDVRQEYIKHLQRNDIGLFHAGGQLEKVISRDEYTSIMRRSKIALNFSFSIPGTHQLKVRVFEIMLSGAMMLESVNSETMRLFEPMVDYVTFDSKQDLLEKVRYYLEHEEERLQIARNGHKKATEQYGYAQFWGQIIYRLEILGVFPPKYLELGRN